MKKSANRSRVVTTIIGIILCAGASVLLKIRKTTIDREIEEFDRIMKERK